MVSNINDLRASLDHLVLPPFLPGETPTRPERLPGHPALEYDPEGRLIEGDFPQRWNKIHIYKCQPGNSRRTEFMTEGGGELAVSTVYLGLDHNFGHGFIIIWETMIFGGPLEDEGWQWRYSTRDAAMQGHQRVVDLLAEAFGHPPQIEAELPALRVAHDPGEPE